MKHQSLRHEVISASAGSGKTFQLVNRYLQLLLNYQVLPEGIVALTFSRKAASEIFDAIIQRLAQATTSDAKRVELGRQIENETIDQSQLVELLRILIHRLHRLRISTYDSFFSWIVKSFPLEFGMGGDFEILTPEQEGAVSRDIITRVLKSATMDRSSQSIFFTAFKKATFGKEEKRLASLLNEFVTTYHEYYLDVPDAALWGNPDVIWPDGCPWFNTMPDLKAVSRDLLDILANEDLNDKQLEKWKLFLQEVERFSGDAPASSNLKYLLTKLITVLGDLYQGDAHITVLKKQHLDGPICSHVVQIVEGIICCILKAKVEKTTGIYRILHYYEQQYDRLVRRSGRLSFRDIEFVLGSGARQGTGTILTQERLADNRLYIQYRLDCRFDHWLLDEFQDTSNRQWQALANLVDEVLQDASGKRSFFYVGDIKQAIHGWRGGDMDLFNQLYESYNHETDHICRKPLSTSFRSAPQIIDSVNRIFCLENLMILPNPVLERWKKSWCQHTTARGDLDGYVNLIRVAKLPKVNRQDIGLRGEVLVNIIRKLPHNSTELSIAVLVRNNKTGRAIAHLLRENHINCTWEGDSGIVDNPLTAVLLSLIKIAQHPGDTYAWHHIQMSPFKDCISQMNMGFHEIVLFVNQQLHHQGVAYTLDYWYRRLFSRIDISAFGKFRIERMLEVARMFDQDGSRNILEFIDLIENHSVSDVSEPGSVRVMTIHKSKGLGFDVVLLPDLQFGGITSSGQLDLAVRRQRGSRANAHWVFSMPIRVVASADRALSDYIEQADNDYCYEELCLLYVAITRAKRCLYMITTEQRSDSNTVYHSTLIERALFHQECTEDPLHPEAECLYHDGDGQWHKKISSSGKPIPSVTTKEETIQPAPRTLRNEPMRHLRPSGMEQRFLSARQVFSLTNRESAGTGTAVHSLFEQIEWLNTVNMDEILKNWVDAGTFQPDIATKARREFLTAIHKPNIQKLMEKPKGKQIGLWREKRFEMVLDNQFISGSFDRVVFHKNSSQQIEAASIIDFKTDRLEADADHSHHVAVYKPQLDLYRKVLSAMINLTEDKISCQLAFTKTDRVIDL